MNSKHSRPKPSRRTATSRSDKWALRLYVAGKTSKSAAALSNLTLICEERLEGKYHLEVIDLVKHPRLAREHQIIAVPTLVRTLPLPVRRVIGDLSDAARVLVGLELVRRLPVKERAT